MLHPHQQAAIDAIGGEFDHGARSVRLREKTGAGGGISVAAFIARKLPKGRCLVLCPRPTQAQVRNDFQRLSPGIPIGDWGSGAAVEVATPVKASLRAADLAADAFAWILVEESHEPDHPRIRSVVAHFSGAKVIEISRMPKPFPGALAADSDIDRIDDPVFALAGPGRSAPSTDDAVRAVVAPGGG